MKTIKNLKSDDPNQRKSKRNDHWFLMTENVSTDITSVYWGYWVYSQSDTSTIDYLGDLLYKEYITSVQLSGSRKCSFENSGKCFVFFVSKPKPSLLKFEDGEISYLSYNNLYCCHANRPSWNCKYYGPSHDLNIFTSAPILFWKPRERRSQN